MSGSTYLATTFPSDYDTSIGWCMTIGKAEYEWDAHVLVSYLQKHGDKWEPVLVSVVFPYGSRLGDGPTVEMPERWLARLQRIRLPRQGPPAPVLNPEARGGVQLLWPNGKLEAAGFHLTDEQVARLRDALVCGHCTACGGSGIDTSAKNPPGCDAVYPCSVCRPTGPATEAL